jgi:hypothetical protein
MTEHGDLDRAEIAAIAARLSQANRDTDLAARAFDKIWLVLQCT